VLTGEVLLNLTRGRFAETDATADTILRLGAEADFSDARLVGLRGSGMCATWTGRNSEARAKHEMLLSLCEGQDVSPIAMRYGHHPHVGGAACLAVDLTVLGYLVQARHRADQAVDLASKAEHLHSRAVGLILSTVACYIGADTDRTLEYAGAARAQSEEQGFEYTLALATMLEASALVEAGGDPMAARNVAERGFAAWEATGAVLLRPLYLAMLAEIHLAVGDEERATRNVAEALAVAERQGERWLLPEIHRLAARLALRRRDRGAAERSLVEAIAIARPAEARLFELRASRDLARLWAERGERQRALDLLTPVYNWFTEGFDTPDLIESKALLEELQ
jgi:predicted ATPase